MPEIHDIRGLRQASADMHSLPEGIMPIVWSLSVGIGQVFALYTLMLYVNENILPK